MEMVCNTSPLRNSEFDRIVSLAQSPEDASKQESLYLIAWSTLVKISSPLIYSKFKYLTKRLLFDRCMKYHNFEVVIFWSLNNTKIWLWKFLSALFMFVNRKPVRLIWRTCLHKSWRTCHSFLLKNDKGPASLKRQKNDLMKFAHSVSNEDSCLPRKIKAVGLEYKWNNHWCWETIQN